MPNKYIDIRINEERFCTEGIAEFSLLNMDAIPAEMEKQQKQKDVVVTVPEIPKRGRKQKKKTTEAHNENKTAN